jgi:hypothetical protein
MPEPKSRLEVIEELFDKSEAGEELKPIETSAEEVEQSQQSQESTEQKVEKTEESETVEQKEAKAETTEVKESKEVVDDKSKTPEVTEQEAAARAGSAPISWKPEAKAAWEALPPIVRQEVTRREFEAQRAMTYSAGARKFTHEFMEVVKPFDNLIRAQNSTPLQAVRNLMTTAAMLTTGNAKQKADIVSDICLNYGVDMQELDSALALAIKNRQNNATRHLTPQQIQMLKPVFDRARQAEEMEASRTEQYQAAADETIQKMSTDPKYPFFNELQEDIADILELNYRRGKKITIEEAYDKATKLHGKVAKAVEQRTDAASVSKAAATLAKARQRASATRGAPSNGGKPITTPKTRREAIEAAFDADRT